MPMTPKELRKEIAKVTAANSEPMSQEDYASRLGLACPFCQESGITTGHLLMDDDDRIYQHNKCDFCGGEWNELYLLLGYEVVARGEV